jgi:hypothetical protein
MRRPFTPSSLVREVAVSIGVRARAREPTLIIENDISQDLGRIYVARVKPLSAEVDMVVTVEDRVSDQLRKVVLAAGLIVQGELLGCKWCTTDRLSGSLEPEQHFAETAPDTRRDLREGDHLPAEAAVQAKNAGRIGGKNRAMRAGVFNSHG